MKCDNIKPHYFNCTDIWSYFPHQIEIIINNQLSNGWQKEELILSKQIILTLNAYRLDYIWNIL